MGNHLKMPDKRQVLALLELRHHLPRRPRTSPSRPSSVLPYWQPTSRPTRRVSRSDDGRGSALPGRYCARVVRAPGLAQQRGLIESTPRALD